MYYREGNEILSHDRGACAPHVVYRLEKLRRSGAWARSAFTSGGWWKSDGSWPTYGEASAQLDALCARLNAPAATPGA